MNSQIDPNKYYSVRYLSTHKIFPGMASHFTLTRYLQTEKGKAVFKPIIKETDSHVKYLISGQVILDILTKAEQGTLIF
jgi:hypothetical protein